MRPSRVHFQGSLKDILDVNVKEVEGQPLLSVDILLQRLYTYSSLKGIGSRDLLIEVSKILGKTICHKGKEKRYSIQYHFAHAILKSIKTAPQKVAAPLKVVPLSNKGCLNLNKL